MESYRRRHRVSRGQRENRRPGTGITRLSLAKTPGAQRTYSSFAPLASLRETFAYFSDFFVNRSLGKSGLSFTLRKKYSPTRSPSAVLRTEPVCSHVSWSK